MKSYKNFTIHQFEEIDSTNSHAFNLVKSNKAFDREVVVADEQSSGRGRMDRKWKSTPGNLFCSIIVKPQILKIPSHSAHKLSFLAILALSEAVSAINKNEANKIQLKWPNDLLINGKKVSGILLESHFLGDFVDFAIIGVGVNIVDHPQNTLFEATSLFGEGIETNRDGFLEIFLDEFDKLYEFTEKFGFDEAFKNIRKSWLKNAYKLNEKVEVNLGKERISGILEDIDKDGSMVLRQNSEKIIISFGDVC